MKPRPPENMHTVRAVFVRRYGLQWMPMGLAVAVCWFGRQLMRAANDEKYK